MSIRRSYSTGTITSFENGAGTIRPDNAPGARLGFSYAICKNFEPAIGDRVKFIYTGSIEVVYLEGERLGAFSMGKIKRNTEHSR